MTSIVGVGASGTFSTSSGGKTYAFNAITNASNTQVAPQNPTRRSVTFINPGTVTIYVSMTSQVSLTGVGSPLVPAIGALGGTIPIPAGAILTLIDGEIQFAWQALAATGTTNPFTVIDSNG